MNMDIGFSVAVIVVLLIASAFFSAAETALTATSRARLTEIERRGSRRATMALQLTKARERLIGTMLLGNNVAIIGSSAFATTVLVDLFGDNGALIASAAMTILILIFGEMMPKTYAITYPDRVSIAVAPIVRVLVAVFGPIVVTAEYIVRAALKLFGVDVQNPDDVLTAHDEIRGAIDLHHKEGSFVSNDRAMMGGVLDLHELENFDVMVHRTKIISVNADQKLSDIAAQVLKSGHSRLPVWRGKPDNIIGIIHAKDLFAAFQEQRDDPSKIKIDDVMSAPWFVPDTRPVDDQMKAFLRRKQHFALVVDEYGEMQGLITLEDIIEEIVGDIQDEHDASAVGARKMRDGSFTVDGSVPIRDLNRSLGWDLPDEEATTLAGLVIHEAQEIPQVGQVYTYRGFRFEVLKKRKHQLTSIKVTPQQPKGETQEG